MDIERRAPGSQLGRSNQVPKLVVSECTLPILLGASSAYSYSYMELRECAASFQTGGELDIHGMAFTQEDGMEQCDSLSCRDEIYTGSPGSSVLFKMATMGKGVCNEQGREMSWF